MCHTEKQTRYYSDKWHLMPLQWSTTPQSHHQHRLLGIQLTVVQLRQLLLGSACPFHGTLLYQCTFDGLCFAQVGSGIYCTEYVLYTTCMCYSHPIFLDKCTMWEAATIYYGEIEAIICWRLRAAQLLLNHRSGHNTTSQTSTTAKI